MFQFPGFAYRLLGISWSLRMGCPIRIFTDQRLFAPPRDFSQLITSFVALESQGIPHTLLVTFFFWFLDFVFFSLLWFDSIFQHVKELSLSPSGLSITHQPLGFRLQIPGDSNPTSQLPSQPYLFFSDQFCFQCPVFRKQELVISDWWLVIKHP